MSQTLTLRVPDADADEVRRIWGAPTGRLLRAMRGRYEGGIWSLGFSPDGKTLASGVDCRGVL